jgi:Na+/H+ antiporter NhaD/arsenite permease-like protein
MSSSIFSISVFVLTLGFLLSGKIHRLIVVLGGAVLMLAGGRLFQFYSEGQAIAAIDFHTLGLLLGMMFLAAMIAPTGLFQTLAVWLVRYSKGKPLRLLVFLGCVTTILSLYLDNITTIVLIAPVIILIAGVLEINSAPLLIAIVILSNTGSTATLVGNPPNILIASAAGISYDEFLSHSFPIVLVVWPIALLVIWFLFRKDFSTRPPDVYLLEKLEPKVYLKDQGTALRLLVVLGIAFVLFLRQDYLGISPAVIATGAAAIALIWIRPDPGEILKRVDWEILLFIAALFVIVGGLNASGVLQNLANLISKNQHLSPVLLGIILLWVAAVFSAVVDNVPATIALIPLIIGLGNDGIPVAPLWWALVFGAGFGGNGSMLGSTTNILAASLTKNTSNPITPALWIKRGLPVMVVTCLVASLLYSLAYPLLK